MPCSRMGISEPLQLPPAYRTAHPGSDQQLASEGGYHLGPLE